MSKTSYPDQAQKIFDQGFNCTQAVFAAFAPSLDLEQTHALKIASGFGGGMHMGSTCGALTGAMMVIGMALGFQRYSPERKAEFSKICQDLILRWKENIRDIDCRDILQIDPTDSSQKQAAKEAGILAERCTRCVRTAAELSFEMLREFDINI